MISMELRNEAEIINLLNQIPRAYESNAVKKLIRSAVKPLVQDIKTRAPKSNRPHGFQFGGGWKTIVPGTLAKSIGTIETRRSRYSTIIVGARAKGQYRDEKAGWYAHFVEFGGGIVKAHRTSTKTGRKRKKGTRVGPLGPSPFMRPAWDAQQGTVRERFMSSAVAVFEKEIARLTKKGIIR